MKTLIGSDEVSSIEVKCQSLTYQVDPLVQQSDPVKDDHVKTLPNSSMLTPHFSSVSESK